MKNDFNRLCEIIHQLRSPEGCPWDREQTHKSLSKHLIEESYEAIDAIEEGDNAKIADELGDVLLQIVMHAEIGSEKGEFTIDDVLDAICTKMIVRHPHVFGNVVAETSEKVLDNWEAIKRSERGQKKTHEAISSITLSLPALMRCDKIIGKIKSSELTDEWRINADGGDAETEVGMELFAVCEKARSLGVDSEAALASFLKKIEKKIKNIEENA